MNNRKDTRNWTIEDMNYMTYEWGIVSVKSMAKLLGRTPVARMVNTN